jgi:hypothetical protein
MLGSRPKYALLTAALLAGMTAASGLLIPAQAAGENASSAIPVFNPSPIGGWIPDRPTGDDFLPPPDGSAGPVMSDPKHPYVPNGGGRQSTYRVADLTNPILKPWAIESMKKANDDVLAGKIPYITRERCWPAGVPGYTVYTRGGQPSFFLQMKDRVVIVNELNTQIRHVWLNVPHTANPKKSWYGESVGHYEGDTLVVDTIGLNDKTFVDNYRTPHTDQIHVVERFRMLEGGKILEATVKVDDPGAFNMAWTGVQRWRRTDREFTENPCENNDGFFSYDVVAIPKATKADF